MMKINQRKIKENNGPLLLKKYKSNSIKTFEINLYDIKFFNILFYLNSFDHYVRLFR